MKKITLFSFIIIVSMIVSPTSAKTDDILYKEVIDSYTRINGKTYRWNLEREIIFQGFTVSTNDDGDKMANIMMEDSQYGVVHEVTQYYRSANFLMTPTYRPNGSLEQIEWKILMTRDAESGGSGVEPFEADDYRVLTRNGHKRYDLKTNFTFFTVNLQYEEILTVDGKLELVYTNTELATNNYDDGRLIRSSITIIKRLANSDVIFEYTHYIQEVSKFASFFNNFDQPSLQAVFQIAYILFGVYIYMRLQRYWKTNNIKIIKDPLEKIN